MRQKITVRLFLCLLCLLLCLPAARAETREGVIFLEGMEEAIEEMLFESPEGFFFWYANGMLGADIIGTAESSEGVIVQNLYSGDYMILSVISDEEAAKYGSDPDESSIGQAAALRTQTEVYCELEENGTFHFLTLIAENGRCLRAVGSYSQEAAEGTAKYFQRVLDSVSLAP